MRRAFSTAGQALIIFAENRQSSPLRRREESVTVPEPELARCLAPREERGYNPNDQFESCRRPRTGKRNAPAPPAHFSAAAISKFYYPASDRGASLIVVNGLAGIGGGAVIESRPRIRTEAFHHARSQRGERRAIVIRS